MRLPREILLGSFCFVCYNIMAYIHENDSNDEGMKNMKKLFSILMSVFLIMGCISIPASPLVDKAEARTALRWGIDVSEHQGKINWEKVKASGCGFAIIRLGYGQDKTSQDDDYWEYNTSECERLGIPYGAYIYSYAKTTSAAAGEAAHTLRLLKGKNLSYPVYFDMEDSSTIGYNLAAIATTYCTTVENAGYAVGVYSGRYWWNTYLTDSCFDNWYRWVAEYNSTCKYNGRYEIWQCTDNWKVDGISGGVDGNYQYVEVGSSTNVEEKLETNKTTYAQGEAIYVTASTATSGAWVSIYGADDSIGSGTPSYYWYWVHGTDTEYGHGGSWSRGQSYNIFDAICSHRAHPNGSVITGALPAGNYKVVVLHGNYQVLMSKNITISNSSKAPYLEVSKTTFAQGEDIKVKAYSEKSNAWVGIFPGTSPSYGTGSYIYYYYTSKYNDTYVSMQANGVQNVDHSYKNLPAGTYTLTLFGDDGYGIIDATKTITINSDALALDKTSYKPGEAVYVTASHSNEDSWVGVYNKGETPGNVEALAWYYVKSSSAGVDRSGQTIEITDPYYFNTDRATSLGEGDYTVYLFNDGGYSVAKSIDFSIANPRVETGRTYTAPTCTEQGSLVIYYSDGTSTKETYPANGHMYSHQVTDPTCTEKGYTTHNCATCGHSYKDAETPAAGHTPGDAASCSTPQKCTVCNAQIAGAKGHTPGAAATCKAPQTCVDCGYEIAPKAGHTPGKAATCKEPQTCTECNKVLAETTGHTPGDAPTCTTDQTCTVCGTVTAKATGHKMADRRSCTDGYECVNCHESFGEGTAHTPGPAATCEEPQKCTVCEEPLKEALTHQMVAATCEDPAKCTRANCDYTEGDPAGHTAVTDKAVHPGCITTGLTEGSHCGTCGETLEEQKVVAAEGHEWKSESCISPRVCTKCSATNGIPAGHRWTEGEVTTEPTCVKNGQRIDKCRTCGETQSVTLSPTGHRYDASEIVEPTCFVDGYTMYECNNEGCDSTKKGPLVAARHTPGPEATCTSPQVCTECDALLNGTLEHTPGPAATCTEMQICTTCETILAGAEGHKAGKAATCTTAQTCTEEGCDYVFAPAKGHTEGREATCTEPQTCTDCDYVFAEAKGHDDSAKATCTTAQRCKNCHVLLSAMLGHTPGAAATCDTPQSCTACNMILQPAKGHDIVTIPAVESTCTSTGLSEGKMCITCGDIFAAQVTTSKKVHEYEDVITPATADKAGKIEEACKHCGKVMETETFAKIGKIKLSYSDTAYTGKKKSPEIVVMDADGEIINAKYYTVDEPSGRINVGKYTYVLTFKDKYEGQKTVTLTIKPAKPDSKKPAAAKKAVTVKWKKYTKQVTGYEVMVATNKNFTQGKKTVTVKKATASSKKVTGLKAKKKYFVKVRSYKMVNGVKYYSNWSDVWNIKTK